MKRFIAVLMIGVLLAGIAITVSADPIGVGGLFSSSARGTVFPGKGVPQGGPFAPQVVLLSSPIGVGGL
ncbi:MAG: hypothetical protein V3T03_06215 [Candidatus Bipolaricaulota bacterium]